MSVELGKSVISVKDLSVSFAKRGLIRRDYVQVTDRVSFDIKPGEFFALVGESGCGKSVTAMSILQLLPYPGAKITSGEILFEGADLTKLSSKELQKIRGKKISCIFQEAMAALNPVLRIRKQLLEALPQGESENLILDLMKSAGFVDPERILNSYPHELSGGQLQRICIVMALLAKPKLLIADEPTTALDVTVQAEVLKLLQKLASEMGTAVLLITHNMALVAEYAARVAVMYAGRIVENGPSRDVILNPLHPYTRGLLKALPDSSKTLAELEFIPGNVPAPADFAEGCRFKDRCAVACDKCKAYPPRIGTEEHFAYCFEV